MGVTIRLRVIDEAGAALAGATVSGFDGRLAITDEHGVATLEVSPGFDCLAVTHPKPAEAQLVFSLGEGSAGVLDRTITLRAGAPLGGTVLSADGTPVAEAMVQVWWPDGYATFVESDTNGAWLVPAMHAGEFEARASGPDFARGSAVVGTHDGRTARTDIVLRVATGARLHGGSWTTPVGRLAASRSTSSCNQGTIEGP